ncbi:MAG: hypothetical protein QOD35_2909 [Nocardioidaceae bacterium]|nr:hypothetical protein [Nocardioidaceae bacterium]
MEARSLPRYGASSAEDQPGSVSTTVVPAATVMPAATTTVAATPTVAATTTVAAAATAAVAAAITATTAARRMRVMVVDHWSWADRGVDRDR